MDMGWNARESVAWPMERKVLAGLMPFDTKTLLTDLSPDQPAGDNLEFDIEFGMLDRAAAGKPEQQYGGTVVPAEDPDWAEVRDQALALLGRTRDLRVLVHLAVAELHLAGIAGFAQSMQAIRDLLETRWAHLHPQLDPEDHNDPTLRANALLRLADPGRVLRTLRDVPLVISPRSGPISWRDLAIATNAIEPPEGRERLSEAVIRGAFQDCDQARLAATRAALTDVADAAVGIVAAFDNQAGFGSSPDFDELLKLLRDASRLIDRFAPTVNGGVEHAAEAGATIAPTMAGGAAPPHLPATLAAASLTGVSTRADAMRLLDLVLDYYRRYEPSSPLPLLLERARRLADKNFIDILRDLAPDGVNQAQFVIGVRDD
jgi:type VI secretion system protein ImpA